MNKPLDALMAVGVSFVECGHPTADTARIMRSCAEGLGISDVGITMVGRTIILEHATGGGVAHRTGSATVIDVIDCARLRALTRTAEAIADGRFSAGQACAAIERTRSATTPWWWSTAGLTALAFFITLQVGVGWLPCLAAAVIHLAASVVGHLAGRVALPRLFGVAAQTLTGGALAVALVALDIVSPVGAAAAVAVSWLLIVPLPQLVSAAVDAIDSEYLAALARVANSVMTLGGIGIGALLVFTISSRTGLEPPTEVVLPTLALPLGLLFSALGAVSNAYANGGRFALVIPAALMGLGTAGVNQLLLRVAGLEPAWASTVSAVALGLAVTVIAGSTGYPPQVLALMGITGALLPGLTVFGGVVQAMSGGSGWSHFADAAWICVGIGVGATFGFVVGSYFVGRRAQQWWTGR